MLSEVVPTEKETQAAAANDTEVQHAGRDLASAGEEPIESTKEVRPIHGWKWVSVVASLYSFALLYGLDTTVGCPVCCFSFPTNFSNFDSCLSFSHYSVIKSPLLT
jgi:hypothetical protein